MIKFEGQLSDTCKKEVIKKYRKSSVLVCCIISIIFAIPFIILSILNNWIFILAVAIIMLLPLFQYFSFSKSTLDLIVPTKIVVDRDNQTITSEGKRFKEIRYFDQINKIFDYGNYYQINFKFPYKSQNFIIEKSLIKTKTIEEFIGIFRENIITCWSE